MVRLWMNYSAIWRDGMWISRKLVMCACVCALLCYVWMVCVTVKTTLNKALKVIAWMRQIYMDEWCGSVAVYFLRSTTGMFSFKCVQTLMRIYKPLLFSFVHQHLAKFLNLNLILKTFVLVFHENLFMHFYEKSRTET